MGKRPIGVTAVAVLTFTSAIPLIFLSLVLFLVTVAGGGPGPVAGAGTLALSNVFPSILAAFAIVLAIGQLAGATWTWFASVIFWINLLTYFSWFAWNYSSMPYGSQILVVSLIPLIYGASCLAYFLTKNPRAYFKVWKKALQTRDQLPS